MRYSVRLAALPRCCESLEQAAKLQRTEIDELRSVIGRLAPLWGMTSVVEELRREVRNMEEQVQLTLSMAQAARRIHQIYRNMELSIIDKVDCPFQLEMNGNCGAPVFPSAAPGPAGGTETGGSAGGTAQAGAAPGGTGAGGAETEAEALRRKNLQLVALMEKYYTYLFGKSAAKLGVARLRKQLNLD